MTILFNQAYAIDAYAEEIRREGIEKGIEEGEMRKAKETALNLSDMEFTAEQIAKAVKVSVQQVQQWLEGEAVLAK